MLMTVRVNTPVRRTTCCAAVCRVARLCCSCCSSCRDDWNGWGCCRRYLITPRRRSASGNITSSIASVNHRALKCITAANHSALRTMHL